jgi:hypothetical protein
MFTSSSISGIGLLAPPATMVAPAMTLSFFSPALVTFTSFGGSRYHHATQ